MNVAVNASSSDVQQLQPFHTYCHSNHQLPLIECMQFNAYHPPSLYPLHPSIPQQLSHSLKHPHEVASRACPHSVPLAVTLAVVRHKTPLQSAICISYRCVLDGATLDTKRIVELPDCCIPLPRVSYRLLTVRDFVS